MKHPLSIMRRRLADLEALPVSFAIGRTFFLAMTILAIASAALYLAGRHGAFRLTAEVLADFLRLHYGTRGQVGKVHGGLLRASLLLTQVTVFATAAALLLRALITRSHPEGSEATWECPPVRWIDLLFCCVLTGAAAAIRLPGLGRSLWLDELGQRKVFVEPGLIANIFPRVALGPQPLLQLMGLLSTGILGDNEVALRLPVFFFSVASVPLLYFVVSRTTESRVSGCLAGLVLAVHTYHIYYSAQFRAYGIIAFLSIVSSYLWVGQLRGPSRTRFWLYVAMSTALLYAHLYAVYVLVAQLSVTLLLAFPHPALARSMPLVITGQGLVRVLNMVAWSLLCAFVLYVPYVPPLMMHHLGPTESISFGQHVLMVLRGAYVTISARLDWVAGATLLGGILLVATWCGRRTIAMILGLETVLFVLFIAATPTGGTGFQSRYLFPAVPLLIWSVASSVRLSAGGCRWLGGLATLVFGAATLTGWGYALGPIQQYREAAEFVSARSCPTALVAANSLGKDLVQFYLPNAIVLTGRDSLERLLQKESEVWVVTSFEGFRGEFFANDPETQRMVESEMVLAARFSGQVPVSVWRTRRRGAPCSQRQWGDTYEGRAAAPYDE